MSRKGNKASLPSKTCVACEKPFTRRKKWKKNRDEVKYCSNECKKKK